MPNTPSIRGFAFLLVLALLAVFWAFQKASPPPKEDKVQIDLPRQSLIAESEAQKASGRDLVSTPAQSAWNVEIHASGTVVEANGRLRFAVLEQADAITKGELQEPQTVSVEAGKCLVEETQWSHLLTPVFSAWFLPDNGFPTRVERATVSDRDEIGRVLVLDLGGWNDVIVTVTDFRGDPIPTARLQVFGALSPTKQRRSVDEHGTWRGRIYGAQCIRLIARAEGYGQTHAKVTFQDSGPTSFDLQLGRLLAYGVVEDMREFWGCSGHEVNPTTQTSFPFRTPDYTSRLEVIESEADFDPEFEKVDWQLITEKEWTESSYRITRIHPDNLVDPETMVVELKHIMDPTLTIQRFPGDWPKELVPVVVHLEPTAHFVSGVIPDSLNVRWNQHQSQTEYLDRQGRRRADGKPGFLFFIPPGFYDLSTSVDTWNQKFGKGPQIETLSNIQVTGNVAPPISVIATLKPDCFYAGYVLENTSGLPLEMGGLLTEEKGPIEDPASFLTGSHSWPQYRFFSGTQCQLWLSPFGSWPISVGQPFTIQKPAPGQLIHIKIPPAELQPILDS